MAEKESRRIETLSEFIEWASQFNDGKYLFRGVSKDCYKIEASAYRRLTINKTTARLLKVNQELIEKAKSQGHDQKNGQQLSDLELLAELQHFGAATCLIDFSYDALIALWFACQQSSNGQANGQVFAVRSDDPARFKTVTTDLIDKNIDHFFKPDERGKYPLYQWRPKLQNNRIIAQDSVFVFGGDQIEAEVECVIMQSSKQAILQSLAQLSNITESRIYPDFDGFARLHAHDKPYVEPDAWSYLQRGIEAYQRADLDSALVYYTELIQLDPANRSIVIGAYYNRGLVYEDQGEVERAIDDYTKAIDLNPNYANAYNNRGLVYENKGEVERAIEDFNRAIQLNPNLAETHNNRALTYKDQGEIERAINDFNRAIQLKPDDAKTYYNRALTYKDQGEIERAINDFNRAIQLKPDDAEAYYNRGVVHAKKEDYKHAIEDYTKAIQLNPNYAIAYNNRGLVHDGQGEIEHAIEDLDRAIDLKPDYAKAYHNREAAQRELERLNESS